MKLLVDFITKLDRRNSSFRDNLVRHLAKMEEMEVIAINSTHKINVGSSVKVISFPRMYKWKSSNNALAELKPEAILLFSKPGKALARDHDCYLYLEALADQQEILQPSRKIKKLLKELEIFKGVLVRTEYLRLYLQNHFGADKERIFVVGQGLDRKFLKENISSETRTLRRVLAMYRVSMPYIFLFGKLGENSYLDKALEAFAQIHYKYPDMKVLLASPDFKIGWDNKPGALNKEAAAILQHCENLKIVRKVIFTGIVERQHMPVLISNAAASIYFADGLLFSDTLVEALAAGSALIVNDSPLLKEITKNAAIYVTPRVVDSISDALQILILDEKERKRLRDKAGLRALAYTWEKVAYRTADRLLFDHQHKEKQRMVLIQGNGANDERVRTLKELFEQYYRVRFIKKGAGFGKLFKSSRECHHIYFAGPGNFGDAVRMVIIKILNRGLNSIVELPEEFVNKQRSSGIFPRIAYRIKIFFLGRYLRLLYNRFVVDNILLHFELRNHFGIREKIDFIPLVFERMYREIDASNLREEYKLKNYVCICVRLLDPDDVELILKLTEILYKRTKAFKFILLKEEIGVKSFSENENKTMKKVIVLPQDKINEILLNSRIYLDMRENIPQEDILSAMKTKNLCIARKTLTSKYLIKQGINGYLFSSLETDKMAKQIQTLIDNKIHLEDIRKINKMAALNFNLKNSKLKLKNIIINW